MSRRSMYAALTDAAASQLVGDFAAPPRAGPDGPVGLVRGDEENREARGGRAVVGVAARRPCASAMCGWRAPLLVEVERPHLRATATAARAR